MGRNKTKFEREEIFRFLHLLEKNYMNQSQTAKDLGISLSSIKRYKAKYWDVYVSRKEEIQHEVVKLAKDRMVLANELNDVRDEILIVFQIVLNEITARFSDPDQVKKIPFKLLIDAFREIAPYVAEKQGLMGIDTPNNPLSQHTSYVQNIINVMNNNGKGKH